MTIHWKTITILLISSLPWVLPAQETKALYKRADAPIEERVADLLKRMTLQEKVAQLSHLHGYQIYSGQALDMKKLQQVAGSLSFGCVEGFILTGENCSKAMRQIQKYMREQTRLGIPILTVTESLHGSVQDGSTIFPQSVALGSTFNPGLSYRMAKAISKELKAQGMWQTLSPGMDVVRDLRWGRVEESFGEDPWLVGQMGIAQVNGYLESGISPMLKPFGPGGAPLGGLNLASVSCDEREAREIYLKPYEMVVKATGIMAIMSSYNSWNRIPNSASKFLLTDVLRNEWGFNGYVYSDWAAVSMLKDFQHTAATDAEAAKQALLAGLDLEASSNCYEQLPDLLARHEIAMADIDRAVRRVLRVKFQLGLFDLPIATDTAPYKQEVHQQAAIDLAKEIADESIVLLKNEDNLLPLHKDQLKSVAIIGPNAAQVQFGDYTWSRDNNDGISPLQGIRQLVGKHLTINYAKGCDLVSADQSGFKEAIDAAKSSDVSLVFVGSSSASLARNYSNATSGEGFDLTDLSLTGAQSALIQAIYNTGKPTVVVLVTGKPFAIPWVKSHIPAIVTQWYGGERGGQSLAEMLFGEINPSGKLPFSFPQSVGHLPVYYNYLPTDKGYYHQPGTPEKPGRDYVFSDPSPLWAFGHGLSYTTFKWNSVHLKDSVIKKDDAIEINLNITNTGTYDGKTVVQAYVRDLVSSVVMPIKQLKAFKKISLKAGETQNVSLNIPFEELAFYGIAMKKVVEPGVFEIQLGDASDHILFKKNVTFIDSSQQDSQFDKSMVEEKQSKLTAQRKQSLLSVTGQISDVQATPVGKVHVKAKLSGKTTLSLTDGTYRIQAYEGDTLVFSAPGYAEEEVFVNQQKNINVRLKIKN